MANISPDNYFIVHIDVYHGKNAKNIGIPEEIRDLLLTHKKAVLNVVIQSGIGNDINGHRCLFMDNRYTAAQLFITLREQFDIQCSGTTQVNMIRWSKEQMALKKSYERGMSKVLYDK